MSMRLPLLAALLLPLAIAAAAPSGSELDQAFTKLASYQFGQDSTHLETIEVHIREHRSDSRQLAAVEQRMIKLLASDQTTSDAKRFICRQLRIIGTESCVPAVAALLTDEEMSHMARYVLEAMQSEEAGAALRQAMGNTSGKTLIGVINSVGNRGDAKAVPQLAALAKRDDAAIADAAIEALGRIADPAAGETLKSLADASLPPELATAVQRARLMWAYGMLEADQKSLAMTTFELLEKSRDDAVRTAARRGMIMAGTPRSLPLALETARQGDPASLSLIATYFRSEPGEQAILAFARVLPELSPRMQLVILSAWADTKALAAHDAVVALLGATDPAVRLAAIEALSRIGNASDIERLARLAIADDQAISSAAMATLETLPGDDIDQAIINLARPGRHPATRALIVVLGRRGSVESLPLLFEMTGASDAAVRAAAFHALGATVEPRHLPQLVALVTSASDAAVRQEAEQALTTVCNRIEDTDACLKVVLAAHKQAPGEARASLLRVLRTIGGDAALKAVRGDLDHEDKSVKDAAVRALCDWRDPAALPALLQIAQTADSTVHKVLALRGFVRLTGQSDRHSAKQKLDLYQQAMSAAPRIEEKRLVLGAMGQLATLETLDAVLPYIEERPLAAEASIAAVTIAGNLTKAPDDRIGPAMRAVIQANAHRASVDSAKKILKQRKLPLP